MKRLLFLLGFLQVFSSAFVFADFTVYCLEVNVTINNQTLHGYFIAPYDNLGLEVLNSFETPEVLLNEIKSSPAYSDSLILFDLLIIPEVAADFGEPSSFYTSKAFSQTLSVSDISRVELLEIHRKWPGAILVSNLRKDDSAWVSIASMKTMEVQYGETLLFGYCVKPTQQVLSLMEDYFGAHKNNNDKRITDILRTAREHKLIIVNICGA
jgi:hypothetical protein